MDNGSLEVDVENAQHVDGVKNDTQNDKPPFLALQPFSSCDA